MFVIKWILWSKYFHFRGVYNLHCKLVTPSAGPVLTKIRCVIILADDNGLGKWGITLMQYFRKLHLKHFFSFVPLNRLNNCSKNHMYSVIPIQWWTLREMLFKWTCWRTPEKSLRRTHDLGQMPVTIAHSGQCVPRWTKHGYLNKVVNTIFK